jgi:hypothetical protein
MANESVCLRKYKQFLLFLANNSMRYSGIWIFILFFFLQGTVWAQVVNVEQTRLSTDSNEWTGKIDATLQYQNVNEVLTNAAARATVQYKSNKYFVLALTEYGYSGNKSVEYLNNIMLHVRYGYRIGFHTRTEVFHQVQRNPIIGIDHRLLHGLGSRFILYKDSLLRIHLGTVVMFESERAMPVGPEEMGLLYTDWRSSSYLNIQITQGIFEFSGTTYYQPLFHRPSDYRVSGQYSMSVKVSKHLTLNQELTHYFDSNPPTPLSNRFSTYTMGLGYVF